MEARYEALATPKAALVRINIGRAKIGDLLKKLRSIGYAESAIFPDLDGLAKELRREMGI